MGKKKKIRKNPLRTESKQLNTVSKPRAATIKKQSKWFLLLRPDIAFTILAFIFGTGFLITTPPFQVPDEIAHFNRAYKLSEFKTFQKTENNVSGDYVPASIDSAFMMFRYLSWRPDQKVDKNRLSDAFKIPLEKKKRKFEKIDAGAYFYLSYLPQYPAIYLGKIFNLNVVWILYIGRFFGLLFYIFCVWYAIKIIPTAKYLLMTVALMPMCLAQAGSSNADCVLFSFSFLAPALLLKLSFEKKKLSLDKDAVLLFIILVTFGVLKPVYMPMALLIFLIPVMKFKNKIQYFSITTSVLVVAFILTIWWLKSNALYLTTDDLNTDTQGKIKHLISNPFYYFTVLVETFKILKTQYYYEAFGVLGYLDTKLPGWVYTSFLSAFIFLILFESNKEHTFFIYQRSILLFIFITVFSAIILSFYLINQKRYGPIVIGVQGRYFIPVFFPFLLVLQGLLPVKINLTRQKIFALVLILVLIIALTGTQLTLIDRYYNK